MNLLSSFVRRNWDRISHLSLKMKSVWMAVTALVTLVAVFGPTVVNSTLSSNANRMDAALVETPDIVKPSAPKTSVPTSSANPSSGRISSVDITPNAEEAIPTETPSIEPSISPSPSPSDIPELIETEEISETSIAPKAVTEKAPVIPAVPSPMHTPVPPVPVVPAPAPAPVVVTPTPTPIPTPAPAPVVDNSIASLQAFAGQQIGNNQQQLSCLITLWNRESNWNYLAENRWSGAYGIPQALPGYKMSSHGADWQTNPRTQILWGVDYIKGRYGTSCNALDHSNAVGWY